MYEQRIEHLGTAVAQRHPQQVGQRGQRSEGMGGGVGTFFGGGLVGMQFNVAPQPSCPVVFGIHAEKLTETTDEFQDIVDQYPAIL